MFRKALTIAIVTASLVTPALAQRTPAAGQKQRLQQQQTKRQKLEKRKVQTRRQKGPDAGGRKLQRQLNLTEGQTEQLRSLLATRQQEIERLRTGNDKKGRKADAQAARDQFQSGLRAILTPEQAAIFDQKGRREKEQVERRILTPKG